MTDYIYINTDVPEYIKKHGLDYHVQQGRAIELYKKDPKEALEKYPEFKEVFETIKKEKNEKK